MKAVHILLAAAAAACAIQANAQGMSMSMPMSMPMGAAGAAMGKEVPFVKADIVKVGAGKVILKHENIPNLDMPAMTMAFPVADQKLLHGVKAGDKVRVKIESIKGQAVVTALEPAK